MIDKLLLRIRLLLFNSEHQKLGQSSKTCSLRSLDECNADCSITHQTSAEKPNECKLQGTTILGFLKKGKILLDPIVSFPDGNKQAQLIAYQYDSMT